MSDSAGRVSSPDEGDGACPNYPATCTGCVQCRTVDEHDGPCICDCPEDT